MGFCYCHVLMLSESCSLLHLCICTVWESRQCTRPLPPLGLLLPVLATTGIICFSNTKYLLLLCPSSIIYCHTNPLSLHLIQSHHPHLQGFTRHPTSLISSLTALPPHSPPLKPRPKHSLRFPCHLAAVLQVWCFTPFILVTLLLYHATLHAKMVPISFDSHTLY